MKKIIFLFAILVTLFILPAGVFAANSVSLQSPSPTGTTVVNNNAGGWVPYLNWADSLPGSAFIYYVEISTQSRVNSLGHFWDSDRVGNTTLNSPITEWNVANDTAPFYLLPGTYYWHVLRWDNYANSSWSSTWSFTVPAVAPIANARLGAMPSSFTFEANQGDTG